MTSPSDTLMAGFRFATIPTTSLAKRDCRPRSASMRFCDEYPVDSPRLTRRLSFLKSLILFVLCVSIRGKSSAKQAALSMTSNSGHTRTQYLFPDRPLHALKLTRIQVLKSLDVLQLVKQHGGGRGRERYKDYRTINNVVLPCCHVSLFHVDRRSVD